MHPVASAVVAIAAVAAAIGFLATWPPVRWVLRRLVVEPYTAWHRAQVTDVMRAEVPALVESVLASRPLTNGWGTKQLTAVAEAVGAEVVPIDPESHDERGETLRQRLEKASERDETLRQQAEQAAPDNPQPKE